MVRNETGKRAVFLIPATAERVAFDPVAFVSALLRTRGGFPKGGFECQARRVIQPKRCHCTQCENVPAAKIRDTRENAEREGFADEHFSKATFLGRNIVLSKTALNHDHK